MSIRKAQQMKKVHTDRSRILSYQRCKRLRWHEYHSEGMGITPSNKPLPLAVGGSFHAGLAVLLECSMGIPIDELSFELAEMKAVQAALEDFSQFQKHLEVDTGELAAMQPQSAQTLSEQLAKSLGANVADSQIETMVEAVARSRSQFDDYLYAEQSALVEALVRAYARRRLRPLLEQYEVLEVEREGEWLLWQQGDMSDRIEGWFMSRPDALLLERESKQLYILSLKTAATWDVRKARDAERDMQGLSEGVEVEKRLAGWWTQVHDHGDGGVSASEPIPPATFKFLQGQSAAPRIMGIRYEYILKGERWMDKDLTNSLGIEVRSQRSHLVRGYLNPGMTSGDEQWNWSWDYHKEDGSASKLYYKTWRGAPVWESMSIKQWIDWLDGSTETFAEEGRTLGYSSKAQATGFTSAHPLDAVFIPPIVVYRQDDDLRDWVEQVEAQESKVAEDVMRVEAASDDAEKRHLLNVLFPQTRQACEYPGTCPFAATATQPGPCFGSDAARREPLTLGRYKVRTVNHPQ